MTDKEMGGISFRCTKDEVKSISEAAKAAGRSRSEFVRDIVLEHIAEPQRPKIDFGLVLPPELQEHFVQGIVLSNLLTQKKMTDNGERELFKQASARATEIVHNMLPPGWSGIDDERPLTEDE